MSDPVTNVEIEDVLSSIRKLVAEETRGTESDPRRERPGRLILTPAQRVRDDAPAPEPVLLTQPVTTPPDTIRERAIDDIPGDARLAEFGDVAGTFPDLDEYERVAEAAEIAPSEQLQDDDAEDTSARGDLNRLIEQEVAAALGLGQGREQSDDDTALSSDAAFIETVEADESWSDEDWAEDEDTAEQGEDAAEAAADNYTADFDDEDDAEEAAEVAEDVTADVAHSEPELPAPPQTLEDKVAALGRLVARDQNDFEEERDRPDADDLAAASEPMDWPDAAPFEEVQEEDVDHSVSNVLHAQGAWPEPQNSKPEESTQAVQSDTTATVAVAAQAFEDTTEAEGALTVAAADPSTPMSLDEDMLRDLVVEIVRQELQGALGERITRNVRKLVRREIHRMLVSQEFD